MCMTSISLLSLLATVDRPDEAFDTVIDHCKNRFINEDINEIENILPTGSPPPFPLLPTPLAVLAAPSPETWKQVRASCESQNPVLSDDLTGGLRILAVITLLVYEAAYTLGLGPVPLLILTEFFPASIRGKCISFATVFIWVTHIIATETVTTVTRSMSLAGSYLFYSFSCLVTIFYVFLFLPETRGKSLHQIAQELRKTPVGVRICNNLRGLPVICNVKWIKRYADNEGKGQSTLIWTERT